MPDFILYKKGDIEIQQIPMLSIDQSTAVDTEIAVYKSTEYELPADISLCDIVNGEIVIASPEELDRRTQARADLDVQEVQFAIENLEPTLAVLVETARHFVNETRSGVNVEVTAEAMFAKAQEIALAIRNQI